MPIQVKRNIAVLLTILFLAGCSSTPAPAPVDKRVDEQNYKAEKAQKELSKEISKIK